MFRVEAGHHALLVGISAVGVVRDAILDVFAFQHVGDLHRTVGLRLNRPHVALLAVGADVEAGVVSIHVQVAAIGVLDGISAVGLGQREAVEQVRGAQEGSRAGFIDGEVAVVVGGGYGLGHEVGAFHVGCEGVSLSALDGRRLHVVAER